VFRPGNETDSFLLLGDGDELSLARLKEGDFDFIDVELLALSACETAMCGGKGADGREIEGFGALAQNQGAKAVLATLWPVADDSTGQFMRNFYRLRIEQNLSKAEALRRAQVAFITGSAGILPTVSATDERAKVTYSKSDNAPEDWFVPDPNAPWAHPYYWGPFILMGHWL
jgi:CHAT domain-containing protein